MKNSILFLSLIFSTFLMACNKEDSPTETPTETAGPFVSFKINGTQYDALSTGLLIFLDFEYTLEMGGNTSEGFFVLGAYDINTTGSYAVTDASGNSTSITYNGVIYSQDNDNAILTITVTKIEAATVGLYDVEGTFEGILYDNAGNSIEISEGKFNAL